MPASSGRIASSVAQRSILADCLAYLRDGDVLVVTKPDRLARGTTELLMIEADLSKRHVGPLVLSMGSEKLVLQLWIGGIHDSLVYLGWEDRECLYRNGQGRCCPGKTSWRH